MTQSSATQRGSEQANAQFNTDRTHPGRWTVTFSNPPINMFVPTTIVELGALMTDLEADPSVKVVVFQSANPDFFIAHLDVAKAAERPEMLGLWRDFVLRLSSTPVVSIAKIRGRTRGIGNEFVLACDMRFASRKSALFGNPEVGVGLVPGGGALEWLPRLVGRSRALEIVLSGDDFDADIAERWNFLGVGLEVQPYARNRLAGVGSDHAPAQGTRRCQDDRYVVAVLVAGRNVGRFGGEALMGDVQPDGHVAPTPRRVKRPSASVVTGFGTGTWMEAGLK